MPTPPEIYIGLMSGTSLDAISSLALRLGSDTLEIIGSHSHPIPQAQKDAALAFSQRGHGSIDDYGRLDVAFGELFAASVQALLASTQLDVSDVAAIGSHGQTVRHCPEDLQPFSLQLGDPNIIAARTGLTTVADFRRRDIALGGQGAPLVPPFHHRLFHSPTEHRAIVNIGGIANITVLAQNSREAIGYDTGPGNALLDAWILAQQQKAYDDQGAWARSGHINAPLLRALLADPYFAQAAPKSTGKEHFNLDWLQRHLPTAPLAAADVQATLVELTALSIAQAIQVHLPHGHVGVCGGGAANRFLMQRLSQHLGPSYRLDSTEALGLAPEWVEAACFAWLAQQRLLKQPIALKAVTGAKHDAILGGVYAA